MTSSSSSPPPQKTNKPLFQRGWIGFGYNYFHTLGCDLYREIPEEAYHEEHKYYYCNTNISSYDWGLAEADAVSSAEDDRQVQQEEQQQQQEEQEQSPTEESEQKMPADPPPNRIIAYQFTEEIPAKPKKKPQQGQIIAPAACSSAATMFLSGERHNRIITQGTIHGRVMDPALEIKMASQSSSQQQQQQQQKLWSLSPSTVTIPMPLPCVELAAGRHFCLARLEGGLAVCSWGAGHFGQLGHGASFGPDADGNNTSTYQATPKVIERLLPRIVGSPILQIAAGDWHGSALTAQGVVLSWGCNRNLQCGRKSATRNKAASAPLQMIPMPISIIDHDIEQPEDPIHITKIVCGKAHTVAISKENRVYCWGASHYGQCAANSGSYRTSKYTRNTMTLPRAVQALKDVAVIDVAAGDRHTLVLTQGGRVFSWGAGSEGQLGIFPPVVCTPKPRLVQDLDFVAIAAGEFNQQQKQKQMEMEKQQSSLGEAAADATSSSDDNARSQAHALSSVPTITTVYASGCCSYAISSSGHLYAWGSNDAGTLGLPIPHESQLPYYEVGVTPPQPTSAPRLVQVRTFDSDHNVLLPRRADTLSNVSVQDIMAGPAHVWCLAEARTSEGSRKVPVGRTLHEMQWARRQQGGGTSQLVAHLSASMSALSSSMSEPSALSSSPDVAAVRGNSDRGLVTQSSTLPTDEEDEATEGGLASSMASLSYSPEFPNDDGVSPQPAYHSSAQRGGRRASRRHSEPGSKSRNFSLRNLLSKIGSSRRNMNASTTQLMTPTSVESAADSNLNNGSAHDSKRSGTANGGNEDEGKSNGKGFFRRRPQNGK